MTQSTLVHQEFLNEFLVCLQILHLFLNLLFINDQLVDSEDKTTNILQSTMKQTRTWIPKRIWTLWGKNYADQDHKGGFCLYICLCRFSVIQVTVIQGACFVPLLYCCFGGLHY